MKNVAIPFAIAPAMKQELFIENHSVRENVMYFFRKPGDNTFHGPYYLHSGYDIGELNAQFQGHMIYTMAFGVNDAFQLLINLRPASGDDLKDGKRLRFGFTFFIRESPEILEGPFVLGENSDIESLSLKLRAGAIYIPDTKQDFTPYKLQHSA